MDTEKMKFTYRITTARFDVPEAEYTTFEMDGDTTEICDEKAKVKFEEVSKKPELGFERLSLYRIDTPAIAEKKSFITSKT